MKSLFQGPGILFRASSIPKQSLAMQMYGKSYLHAIYELSSLPSQASSLHIEAMHQLHAACLLLLSELQGVLRSISSVSVDNVRRRLDSRRDQPCCTVMTSDLARTVRCFQTALSG